MNAMLNTHDEVLQNINVVHRVINEHGSVDNNPDSGVDTMIFMSGGIACGNPVLHDGANSRGEDIDALAEGAVASTSNGCCGGVVGVSTVSQRGGGIPRPVRLWCIAGIVWILKP